MNRLRTTDAGYLQPQHFKGFGRVVDIRLMSNFGFVEFETVDVSDGWSTLTAIADVKDVEAACRGLDGKDFQGERYGELS